MPDYAEPARRAKNGGEFAGGTAEVCRLRRPVR